jgi:hypothetical protein
MKTLMLSALALAFIGCKAEPQPAQPAPSVAKVEIEVKPQPLVIPPVYPVYPGKPYLVGYNDGFHGNWIAPIRWTFANDYRNGWSAGEYDRLHGRPYRFSK